MADAQQLPAVRPVEDIAQPQPSSALAVVERWTEERKAFVRKRFCGGAPDHVADLFLRAAERKGLSPEDKQLYVVLIGGEHQILTGIDGYRALAARTDAYAGSDPPVYEWSGELANKRRHPLKATVTVYRMVQGQRCPFTASVLWDEFGAGKKANWLTMPAYMLAKVAESHALRKAFPVELSGIYTDAEMDQADIVVQGREVAPTPIRSPAPSREQTANDDAPAPSWNQFWTWARSQGYKRRDDIEPLIGEIGDDPPAKVKHRLEQALTAAPKAPANGNGTSKKPPRERAMAALHAWVGERYDGDPHKGLKLLQRHLYDGQDGTSSLTDEAAWSIEGLRDFYRQLDALPPADVAMIVTSEDDVVEPIEVGGRMVDPATGEILDPPDDRPVTDREAALIEVRDRAHACASDPDWTALVADIGDDGAAWTILAETARTTGTINLLRRLARQAKANTPELEGVFNRQAKAIRAAIEAATP